MSKHSARDEDLEVLGIFELPLLILLLRIEHGGIASM